MKRQLFWARTLRSRTLAVVLAVALAPLVFVWGSDLGDATVGERMRQVVLLAANQSAKAVEGGNAEAKLSDSLDRISWTYAVRVRVLDADGQIAHDIDQEHDSSVAYQVGGFFFGGGEDAPSLARWDSQQPPLADRDFLTEVRSAGRASRCQSVESRTLLVCEAGVQLSGGQVVFVQQSSRRAIRSLYDARYPILKLTLFVAVLAVLLGWWLGWTWVWPIEKLRDEALDRVSRPLSAPPIQTDRDDEIGDLARAFDTLLAAVRERSQENEAFVADLAHEMKNPVAAIRAASESLASGREIDAGRAARLARVLTDSSQRLDQLVTGLLELARVEAGAGAAERAPVAVHELVAGIVDAVSRDERFGDVVFVADRSTPAVVLADAGQLETALRNLIINAASFAGPGGTVQTRVSMGDVAACIEVSDTGPGIAAEHLDKVFDRFYTTRGAKKGTGLGLALVKAVVEAHGGSVSAQNRSEGGAMFQVELPVG